MKSASVQTSSFLPPKADSCNVLILFSLFIFFTAQSKAQDNTVSKLRTFTPSVKKNSDSTKFSLLTPEQIKKRTRLIIAGNIVGYGGAMVGLYSAWYKDYPQSGFHTFNDWHEWKQVDKVGHLYSAYVESRGSMELWRWTGIDRKKRIWIGGMSGAFYQTVIETLDGFSEQWGWSWADFGANILGSGILVAQELAWNDQRIKLKFSFHKKNYSDQQLQQRTESLFGRSDAERFLKDYNGQTYWASANIRSFFPQSNIPPWLEISLGYGAEGLFGGTENIAKDENGNIIFERTDVPRRRQWYIAPDIDLSKIKRIINETTQSFLRIEFSVLISCSSP